MSVFDHIRAEAAEGSSVKRVCALLDRTLKTNTVKTRTMSLLNQGLSWYRRIQLGTLREDYALLLLPHYERILREHKFLAEILRFDG